MTWNINKPFSYEDNYSMENVQNNFLDKLCVVQTYFIAADKESQHFEYSGKI